MSKKNLSILIIIVALIAVAVAYSVKNMKKNESEINNSKNMSSSTTEDKNSNPEQKTSVASPGVENCTRSFDKEKLASAKVDINTVKAVTMQVRNYGTIKVQLYAKDAPKTVENFLRLVNAGYYDCLTFHRVAKSFVVQGGDPTGTGSGGDSAFGADFADELNQDSPSFKAGYIKGVLAMANRGPNTNSSQFFIMLGDVPLPHLYTIFGKVVEGQDTVDKIGQVEIIPQLGPTDGTPKEKVVIEKALIIN